MQRVQSRKRLHDAQHFSQYIAGNMLITLIGIAHDVHVPCPAGTQAITITEYCTQTYQRNPVRSKIYLEISPELAAKENYNDFVIKNTIAAFSNIGQLETICAADTRYCYVPLQEMMYNPSFSTWTTAQLKAWFLKPFEKFYSDAQAALDVDELHDLATSIRALYDKILIDIDMSLVEERRLDLTQFWAMIMDYRILYDIFTLNHRDPNVEYNEIVIVVGDYHRQNMESVLDRLHKRNPKRVCKLNSLSAKNSCVDLFHTYTMDSEQLAEMEFE